MLNINVQGVVLLVRIVYIYHHSISVPFQILR